ncbi:MAG: enoyl-CoA hydratase-related protein [Acetobacterales bacterium]
MSEELLFEVGDDKVAVITLNRPDKRNAFTQEMIDAWLDALEECRTSDAINAVIVTGTGSAFCSGGDVRNMGERGEQTPLMEKDRLWQNLHRLPRAFAAIDKPVIAAVNGAATGAGMDIALMADIRFAGQSARFAESYVKVGLVPGEGGAWYLPRIVGVGRALEMLWTGDFVSAEEAERIGLVNKVLPDDELMSHSRIFAARLAAGPAVAIRLDKRAVYQGLRMDLESALDMVSSHIAVVRNTEDYKNAIAAFREKKTPIFEGR